MNDTTRDELMENAAHSIEYVLEAYEQLAKPVSRELVEAQARHTATRIVRETVAAHSEYLWQAADSYDFFDALEEWVQTNDNHEPEMIAKFTVEYLIGPKPQGDKR